MIKIITCAFLFAPYYSHTSSEHTSSTCPPKLTERKCRLDDQGISVHPLTHLIPQLESALSYTLKDISSCLPRKTRDVYDCVTNILQTVPEQQLMDKDFFEGFIETIKRYKNVIMSDTMSRLMKVSEKIYKDRDLRKIYFDMVPEFYISTTHALPYEKRVFKIFHDASIKQLYEETQELIVSLLPKELRLSKTPNRMFSLYKREEDEYKSVSSLLVKIPPEAYSTVQSYFREHPTYFECIPVSKLIEEIVSLDITPEQLIAIFDNVFQTREISEISATASSTLSTPTVSTPTTEGRSTTWLKDARIFPG
ncbi:MAG: hypothetical protein HEEMFOPI_00147 [Holosporales bacterium]